MGGFHVFPQPSTPPEPAPPDRVGASAASVVVGPRWQPSLPAASSSHTSLDDAACNSFEFDELGGVIWARPLYLSFYLFFFLLPSSKKRMRLVPETRSRRLKQVIQRVPIKHGCRYFLVDFLHVFLIFKNLDFGFLN